MKSFESPLEQLLLYDICCGKSCLIDTELYHKYYDISLRNNNNYSKNEKKKILKKSKIRIK